MPLYEEKFISPLAIRFSQERARPTFQDGRLVSQSLAQIKVVAWPWEHSSYDVLLVAPFPTIEIIRWTPKLRDEDGEKCLDEEGRTIMGESCWFTLDNRRLYCLQAAAAGAWPKRAACVVDVLHDLPLSKTCPKKFDTRDLGFSVRLGRRNDQFNSRAIWNWQEVTKTDCEDLDGLAEEDRLALQCVREDAAKEEWVQLVDVPGDMPDWRSVEDQFPNRVIETAASAAALDAWRDTSADGAGAAGDGSDEDAAAARAERRERRRHERHERQALSSRAERQEPPARAPAAARPAPAAERREGHGEWAPQAFHPRGPPGGGLAGDSGYPPQWGHEQPPWDDPWAYQQMGAPGPDVATLWRAQQLLLQGGMPPGPFGAGGLAGGVPPRFRMPAGGYQDARGWGQQQNARGWPRPAGAGQWNAPRQAPEASAPQPRPRAAAPRPAAAGPGMPPAPRPRAEQHVGAVRAAPPQRLGLAGAGHVESSSGAAGGGAGASAGLGLGLPRAAEGDEDDDGEGCEQQ